jgi:hypothetical protein
VSPSKEECQAELDRICERARLRKLAMLNPAGEAKEDSSTGAEAAPPAGDLAPPAPVGVKIDMKEEKVESEPVVITAAAAGEEPEPALEVKYEEKTAPAETKTRSKLRKGKTIAADALILCKGIKKDGSPCTVRALEDGYCFAHSPSLEDKRKEASKKGGTNSSKVERLNRLVASRFGPVSNTLESVLEELKSNKMDPKTAQAIANVSRVLITVLTLGDLEERVRVLEEKREEFLNVAQESDREAGGEASR